MIFFLLTNPRQIKELLILLWVVDEHPGVETKLYLCGTVGPQKILSLCILILYK